MLRTQTSVRRAVKGSAIATTNAINDDAVRAGFGKSRQGRPLVRMMKITRICVAIDSRNQRSEFLGCGVEDQQQAGEGQHVEGRRQRAHDAAKRIRSRMFQTCGRAVASGRTVSKGMPISEKS